ncbi:protein-disulfide reductase DsbD [Denitromonas ohlonensis]|uniref:Thiol:disulfide interchange protein DsbD n=2 Tax=Denitromonas TaxID=139331 RepID=A0A557SE23_9RHOO|nr:protein-disulfide reductase DsbD [Denitromonas ohlonensis]TVO64928.1 protein-disulfide reductase DsbD [Denitromonas ohlonensis]TVO75601.1 protein-disulfide reductase DsbD [Denitromonas ohlonensis]
MIRILAPLLLLLGLLGPAQAQELLPPEQAYRASVSTLAPDQLEVRFEIVDGYYLYKDKFQFRTEPESVVVGTPALPAGKKKNDEFFGEVETYRDELIFTLPVQAPADVRQFELTVISQGCADIGVCYPPTPQNLTVDLTKTVAPTASGGWLQKLGIGGKTPAPAMDTPAAAAPAANVAPTGGGDESGRIARLFTGASVPLILVSFFGFGLLLSFTPCTFPMIPILSGIIVGHGHKITKTRALVLSLAYVLGMAVTYAAAGVAAGISGTLLSAALQNAWVLGSFALLFVVLSLSMFGFYELQLPTALQSRLSDTASHEKGGSLGGVVIMGVLSALIVGPCVAAPLAGALLYIAQTGDAVLGGVALFVMALGMGAPLIVVGVAARSVLPKAGPWMEGVKKAFGMMLLALAVWMISPVVPAVVPMLGWGALLVFSGIFLHALDPLPPNAHSWRRFWKGVGVIALLAGAAMLIGALAGSRDPLQPLAALRGGQAVAATTAPQFEKVKTVAELDARIAASTRPVMLDFYADWCVSCKEMERFTFSDPAVQARMGQMLLLKADVTANTADDQALLKRFGLFGPPGIIFFTPGGSEIAGQRVVGFMPADDFTGQLDAVLTR